MLSRSAYKAAGLISPRDHWEQKQIAEGRCRCGREREAGKSKCSTCLERNRNYMQSRRNGRAK